MTTASVASLIETKRMWTNGPLRLWAPVLDGGCRMPLANGGFGGAYVCEACLVPVAGVYRVITHLQRGEGWFCASCKAR